MRRSAAAGLVVLSLVAAACGGGGRETPDIVVPEIIEGRVTIPEGLAASVCRLAVGTGHGAEVVSVASDLQVGAVLQQGDVITEIDGSEISESADLISLIRAKEVGDSISVHVVRGGSGSIDADLTLVEHSDGSGAPMLGVTVRTAVDLLDAASVEPIGSIDSPLTAVVSVDGSLYAVDALEGNWLSLNALTPEDSWVPAAGSVFTLEIGDPDRVVDVTTGSSIEFVAEGWDGRWVLGSQAGLVLVYADRPEGEGLRGAIFAIDPASGAVEWFWSPQDSERTDNPLPIFAVSSPDQQRTLVGTAQFDGEGSVEVLRFSLLDRSGENLLVVPPSGGAIPEGSSVIGWHDDSNVAYQQAEGVLLWNVDTGDLTQIELPVSSEGVQFVPVGDGSHFIVVATDSLQLVSTGEGATMRRLAVDCEADQVAPPGFVS